MLANMNAKEQYNCVGLEKKNIKILQSPCLQSLNVIQFYWKTRMKFAKSSYR